MGLKQTLETVVSDDCQLIVLVCEELQVLCRQYVYWCEAGSNDFSFIPARILVRKPIMRSCARKSPAFPDGVVSGPVFWVLLNNKPLITSDAHSRTAQECPFCRQWAVTNQATHSIVTFLLRIMMPLPSVRDFLLADIVIARKKLVT
jgi:hypothetical protein